MKEKILVIDDEPEIRKNLKEFLETEEFEVNVAPSGEAGLRRFSKNPYDLVIVDIFMPKKDGLETIDEIRKINLEVQIIIITGGRKGSIYSSHSGEMLNCRIILKPIDFGDLLEAVLEVLPRTGTD